MILTIGRKHMQSTCLFGSDFLCDGYVIEKVKCYFIIDDGCCDAYVIVM